MLSDNVLITKVTSLGMGNSGMIELKSSKVDMEIDVLT